MEDMMTPLQVAQKLGVGHQKVLTWIDEGELRAVNTATRQAMRPQYRIMREEFDRFVEARTTGSEQPISEG